MQLLDLNLKPDRKTLFQFGFVCLVAFGLLGGLIYWRKEFLFFHLGDASRTVAFAMWGVGALAALFSLVAPGLNRFIFVGIILITYPIGFVVSHVLMGVLFYLVITPVGLFFKLTGRDPLTRRLDRSARTHWVKHEEPDDVERYFRQY